MRTLSTLSVVRRCLSCRVCDSPGASCSCSGFRRKKAVLLRASPQALNGPADQPHQFSRATSSSLHSCCIVLRRGCRCEIRPRCTWIRRTKPCFGRVPPHRRESTWQNYNGALHGRDPQCPLAEPLSATSATHILLGLNAALMTAEIVRDDKSHAQRLLFVLMPRVDVFFLWRRG